AACGTFPSNSESVHLQATGSTTQQAKLTPNRLRLSPLLFATVFAGLFCGIPRKTRQMVLAMLAIFLISSLISCAGGGSTTQGTAPRSPTNATLTITGNSANQSASTTLSLTITP